MPATRNKELSAKLAAGGAAREEGIALCKAALENKSGNVREAAAVLRVTFRTLYRWMDQYPAMRPVSVEPTHGT